MSDDKTVTLEGQTLHLEARPLEVGDDFPNFRVVAGPADDVEFDDHKSDAVHIITTAVSVDTPVCAKQVRAFDERAEDLRDEGIEVWYVTRDLPFAMDRFAEENGLDHVEFMSDYKDRHFGEATGLAVQENELLARATFVVDRDGEIVYSEILEDISGEPDYSAAVEAAREAAA